MGRYPRLLTVQQGVGVIHPVLTSPTRGLRLALILFKAWSAMLVSNTPVSHGTWV